MVPEGEKKKSKQYGRFKLIIIIIKYKVVYCPENVLPAAIDKNKFWIKCNKNKFESLNK